MVFLYFLKKNRKLIIFLKEIVKCEIIKSLLIIFLIFKNINLKKKIFLVSFCRMKNISCPCKSGLKYKICCGLFHEGKNVKDIEKLVRARYSAYVLGFLEYIIKTTHPLYVPLYSSYEFDEKKWMKDLKSLSADRKFIDLKILHIESDGKKAFAFFYIKFMEKNKERGFLERNFFEKINGKWFYKLGNILEKKNTFFKKTLSSILPIAYITDPIFEKKKKDILKIDDELKKFIGKMKSTCDLYNGAGLAASQVHSLKNLFIMKRSDDYDIFLNPKILEEKGEWEMLEEACLCIPYLSGEVDRKNEIVLEYMDMEGNIQRKTFFSFQAKVCMHEIDHLKGIFFTDRMKKKDLENIGPALKTLKNKIQNTCCLK